MLSGVMVNVAVYRFLILSAVRRQRLLKEGYNASVNNNSKTKRIVPTESYCDGKRDDTRKLGLKFEGEGLQGACCDKPCKSKAK